MYSTYELLPDKKMPAPAVMKKEKSNKSLIKQTEAGEIEDKERETEEKSGPTEKEKVTVESEGNENESAETDTDSAGKQGKCEFVSIINSVILFCLNSL